MKIVSYNCRGINKLLRPSLKSLLNDHCTDIICLQETWLTKQDLGCLNTLHEKFNGVGCSTTDTRDGPIIGHPPGGVAILWRATMSSNIQVLDLEHDWLCGIQFTSESQSFIILCVYMPCFSNEQEREEQYTQNLGILQSVLEDLPSTSVFIIGDWNADVSRNLNSFGYLLEHFCDDLNLSLSSHRFLPQDTFTYVSDAWDTTSWLDHCVTTEDAHNSITNMSVYYHIGAHDHIPFSIDIAVSKIPATIDVDNDIPKKLDWSRLSSHDIDTYTKLTDEYLSEVALPRDHLMCSDMSCSDENHIHSLTVFYNEIVSCLRRASDVAFSNCKSKRLQCRPGWTDYVEDAYTRYREAFRNWSSNGKPRHGVLHEEMRTSRARFKYSLRFIKQHEESLRCDAIARKFSSNNPKSFWKEIRKCSSSRVPLPDCINGVNGKRNISELWRNHFHSIFNCLTIANDKPTYQCVSSERVPISPGEIAKAICSLVDQKACGLDNISAEHLKFSSRSITIMLSMCFTSFLVHGFLPSDMISVVLIPLIKDKSARINCMSNYRPIAIASVLSKVVESIILDRIQDYICTNSNQFGFKPGLGTEMPVYMLKEIIDRYKCLNGNVFTCFLDASKAFDRVNHSLLFHKLLDRGVPHYLVRILDYWYCNQTMCVRWAGITSTTFKVSNGVRQGGILSPYLFNVYVDDLSNNLNRCNTGCVVGNSVINHVMYADDLVIFSPCEDGLSDLLKTCENFGFNHDMLFNSNKSAIMIFKNSTLLRDARQFSFCINHNVIPSVNEYKYLGHYITDNLKDDRDILRQRRMLYAQGNLLRHRFRKCTTAVKVTLFKTFCYSLYCSPLWWNYTSAVFRSLKVAYNDAFRMLFCYSRYTRVSPLFINVNIFTFEALLRHRLFSFMNRLVLCKNVLIQAIFASDIFWCSRIRYFWFRQLYNIL